MLKIFGRGRSTENDAFCGIGLGDKVKDTLSGFTGIVLARSEHITGCNQLFVLPSSEKDNKLNDGQWFDVERIEKLEDKAVEIASRRTGADIPLPRVTGRSI
ncbi:hypothetical protein [Pseudovibrio sp. Ad26]|uniref:hypothetical protein n=1 Tax=Pseudovibrio sp. Ad26 TaxID=989410 RepID=UPI0007AE674E|nr:hypothetical protein [Pseudovibrio sp. Ad26]KZK99178.1 hypothetical protein PsAD26_04987 [Pseudovibrio sp. Ad26]